MLIPFEKIDIRDKSLGGKAWGLGVVAQRGFAVPSGLVLSEEPSEAEWLDLLKWWRELGQPPLAVRSSASAEDSAETSFAGQNRTFLNVCSEPGLRTAIRDCFASVQRDNSRAYREFFLKGQSGRMNVVLQKMVEPRFAGVFFSADPVHTERGWVLEVIAGLGEDLVSGKINPGRLYANGDQVGLPLGFTRDHGAEVSQAGLAISQVLGFPLDMEWAFDHDGRFHVLQARPITAAAKSSDIDFIQRELERVTAQSRPSAKWDGQTFAEWSGLPSLLTFSIWRKAFSPHHAFGSALSELGYRGFTDAEWLKEDSLLERVFGRAFVNLDRLTDLYYGDIPYSIELHPRPHTVFDRSKLTLTSFARFPSAAWNMVKVAWNLSTKRKAIYQKSLEELSLFKHRFARPLEAVNSSGFDSIPTHELLAQIQREAEEFTSRDLHWPLVIAILIEATTQNLRQLLKGVLGEKDTDRKIREWMGKGLHTVTSEMQAEFTLAAKDPQQRNSFLARFGHRGPGEMDLAHPRWFELGDKTFVASGDMVGRGDAFIPPEPDHEQEIEAEIHALMTFKRDMILEEWRLLKKLLEAREAWKMELLRPYAWLRLHIIEIGRRSKLGNRIFSLSLDELQACREWIGGDPPQELIKTIRGREAEEREFRKLSFPDQLSLASLSELLTGSAVQNERQMDGEPLSPGIAFGEIRFVTDPINERVSEWPENVILAAVSTDPGWTPLFVRAKGIIMERGGVLSHCAILSREMKIPAVGGILGLENKLKTGDRVWIDGHHGRITRDPQ